MESEGFGVFAMLAFWASAIGGIVFAVSWAKSKGQGASDEVIRNSLKKRLEAGDLTQEQYDQRISELESK